MTHDTGARRRRSIGWLIPALIVVIVVAGWSAFWFYAAERARDTMAGWIEREAHAGRVYACGQQSLGGFPFRIEIRCDGATASFEKARPPVTLAARSILAAVQVYQPTLVLAEIDGPLTVADPGQSAKLSANWALAQLSLRGTPRNPQRVSMSTNKLTLDSVGGDKPDRVFAAENAQLHGRLASGTVRENPVIDIAASLKAATARIHPLAATPFDFDGDTRLIGLRNFQPKSWAERFKEIQQANGRIEVRNMRLKQGDLLAVASGNLSLTRQGFLDGELTVTATGIEKLLPALGIEALARQGGNRNQRLGAALSLIDQMAPGAISSAVSLLGEPVELEGRKATRMPLRFKNGFATLGPVKLGQLPPLF
ncbi:DUF2125 domain-containing protein [Pseudorhodoplanes sp.]|uniref:DUF2125 domain-containing protein n=1 Tax=Pseudorhodoplanes sp. TaxID=1934341 RepID=UPI002C415212|nr:DUF2125 domain-containing protein [Pseudorhodoplanes sp.]HWV40752.1 DUF2125 domain-containing protein [Pseudorhodoplanes sp.]